MAITPAGITTNPSRAMRPGQFVSGARATLLHALLGLTFAQPVAADVVIGLAGPFTGRFTEVGSAMRAAAESAVTEINGRGGIAGRRLRLESVDDGCTSEQGRSVASTLVAQGASVVVGHWCANAAVAAAPVYAQANVVLLALTRHAQLTDKRAGPGIFRLAGRDDQQGEEAARYVANVHKQLPVALVHDRTAYARSLADGFHRVLAGLGMPPVLVEGVVASEKDYSTVAVRIKAAGARLVYFAGFPSEAAILLGELRTVGSPTIMLGPDTLATPDFAERAGQDAEGTIVTVSSAAGTLDAAASLVRAGAQIAARTLAAEPESPAERAALLGNETFATSIGSVAFDSNGDASIASYAIYHWREGRLVRAD